MSDVPQPRRPALLRRLLLAATRPLGVGGSQPGRGEVVTVDVGGSGIRLARVRRAGEQLELLDSFAIRIPPPDQEGAPPRGPAVEAALREAVRARRLRGKPAVGLVPGLDVVLRRTTMPDMTGADLLSALSLEAQKYVSFPADHIAIDAERLGPAPEPGHSELLVAACDRPRVAEVHRLLTQAGLKVLALTAPPLAFRSVMRHTRLGEDGEVTALFDIGLHTTTLCIFKRDELRFSRELSIGSQTLTEALRTIIVPGQPTVQLSQEEAERLKLEHGIPMGEDEKRQAGGIPLAHVAIMLRPTLERLVREIWSSFDYCNEEFFGESVQRVFLAGRGAQLRNLGPYLEGVLKVPVTVLDVGRDVLSAGRAPQAAAGELGFAPALALEDFSGINLLRALEPPPSGARERLAAVVTVPRLVTAAALVLALDGGLTWLHHAEAESRVRALARARAAAVVHQPELQALEARMQALRAHQTLLARLSDGRPEWPLLLKDLSLRIGPAVRLSELSPDEARPDPAAPAGTPAQRLVVLRASLQPAAGRPEEEIAATLRALMASPFFKEVRLVELTPASDGRTQAVISCTLRGTP
ncbi:MAG TPA: pilus assembly protein PilM [Candidatus Saccharimonadales bacterium]|nr:pilus assembly protein PilM [Candidatus Saccharimonadales bacterium]